MYRLDFLVLQEIAGKESHYKKHYQNEQSP